MVINQSGLYSPAGHSGDELWRGMPGLAHLQLNDGDYVKPLL